MKKMYLIIGLLSLVAGYLFAGGADETGTGFIGIAMPETHVARWVTDGEALKENAEAMGYKAEVAFGDGDQTKQNKQN